MHVRGLIFLVCFLIFSGIVFAAGVEQVVVEIEGMT